ncbi:MAG TPA: NfeD family protein [Ruminococcaceae bacterium]|nr:NfeD family protein [Oscillospiraceae bacterium]
MPYCWLAVIIIATLIEIFTAQLVSVWFAVGGTAALAAALLNAGFNAQLLIFALVSAVTLAATRPVVKKHLTVKKTSTNADRYIGRDGIVTVDINNAAASGQVNVLGSVWTARSADGSVIIKGQHVKVESIQGVKLIVSRQQPGD